MVYIGVYHSRFVDSLWAAFPAHCASTSTNQRSPAVRMPRLMSHLTHPEHRKMVDHTEMEETQKLADRIRQAIPKVPRGGLPF